METTNDTPTAAPSPTGGSAPKSWRWMAIGAASLALMTAGLGIGVAQAQTDGGDTTTTTEAPGDVTPDGEAPERPTDEEIEAFQACMADNGVDLPDERPARGERPERTEEERAAFEAALEACDELKPEGFGHRGPGGPGGPGCDGDEATEPGADAEDTAATTGS